MPIKLLPKSNLADLTWPIKNSDISGFLYLYQSKYKDAPILFFTVAWLAYLFPNSPKVLKSARSARGSVLNGIAGTIGKKTPSALLKLKKESDGFSVTVPVAVLGTTAENPSIPLYIRNYLASVFSGVNEVKVDEAFSEENIPENVRKYLDNPELTFAVNATPAYIDSLMLSPSLTTHLKDCFKKIHFVRSGSTTTVSLEFFIPKTQAELMASTNWVELRNIDLYPMLLDWVLNGYGQLKNPALQSLPVSRISKHLSKDALVRVNENNLSAGPDGKPYFILRDLDNTDRYERLYDAAGDRSDGSFQLTTVEDILSLPSDKLTAKLPANVPVLVDWTNSKFSYTLSNGSLQVMDLSRFRPATPTHIVSWLNQPVGHAFFLRWSGMAGSVGMNVPVPPVKMDVENEYESFHETHPEARARLLRLQKAASFLQYATLVADDYCYFNDIPVDDLRKANIPSSLLGEHSQYAPARPIGKFISDLFALTLQRLDNLYKAYSVAGTLEAVSVLAVIAHYADRYGEIYAEDRSLRSAAISQGIDPNYQPQALPLISDKVGRMPHQKRIANRMKDDPDLAVFPVQAGGGKTFLGVEDILKQVKKNTNFPYLVMCPSHLVAQYVSEINFFTDGRLNAIGINTGVVKREGFKRVGEMIMSMPRNSIVIVDYDVLRLTGRAVCYGTSRVQTYPIAEFLAQFNFGYVFCDESHVLKNDSKRSSATMALIANIPKKRLASGTLLMDSPVDLAMQIAILDPTIFGTPDDFREMYGEEFRGSRVIKWKESANTAIMQKLKERVVWAPARRREWAAWLPWPKYEIHRLQLSYDQQLLYDALFKDTLEQIQNEDSKRAKKLRELLSKGKDNEEYGDEDAEEIEKLLKWYIARVERYISNPAADPEMGPKLPPNEQVSPVPGKVADIVQKHISAKIPGKILVFTSYHTTAEAIYDNLPPALKERAIHYKSTNKIENKNAFESDPNKIVMIGVENSMNTGLNLQSASRLIRVESVFNPGTLEQGQARILRPQLKKKEDREFVYFDWIVVDKTIAVTKMARLISKMVTITKFEEHDNPLYLDVPDVPIVPLDMNTIEELNDFNSNLMEYLMAYRSLEQATYTDYQQYKDDNPGEEILTPVERAPDPEGVAAMKQIPYINGMDLPFKEAMGLIRMDEFMRGISTSVEDALEVEDESSEDEEGEEESSDQNDADAGILAQIIGKRVQTGWGDGEVLSVGLRSKGIKRAKILLDTGNTVTIPWTVVFVMEKPVPMGVPSRDLLLEKTGLKIEDKVESISHRIKESKKGARLIEKKRIQSTITVELAFIVTNGFLGIHYVGDEDNETGIHALQAAGFKRAAPLFFTRIPTARHLYRLFESWMEAGFKFQQVVKTSDDAFQHLYMWMKSGRMAKRNAPFNFARKLDLVDFYKKELKPNSDAKLIKPYPIIEDGQVYVALPALGQVGSQAAIRVKVPGIRWQKQEGAYIFHALNLNAANSKIKELLKLGVEISNIDELSNDFKKLRRTPIRDIEDAPLSINLAKVIEL